MLMRLQCTWPDSGRGSCQQSGEHSHWVSSGAPDSVEQWRVPEPRTQEGCLEKDGWAAKTPAASRLPCVFSYSKLSSPGAREALLLIFHVHHSSHGSYGNAKAGDTQKVCTMVTEGKKSTGQGRRLGSKQITHPPWTLHCFPPLSQSFKIAKNWDMRPESLIILLCLSITSVTSKKVPLN